MSELKRQYEEGREVHGEKGNTNSSYDKKVRQEIETMIVKDTDGYTFEMITSTGCT